MGLPLFDPMFDERPSILGVPVDLVLFAIGMALAVGGLLLWRRLLPSEPEAHSFRATNGGSHVWPNGLFAVGIALLVFVAALVVSR
jgi:hypothetical protein